MPVDAVYVHAPFCTRRCPYCDFAVTVRSDGDAVAWADALAAELDLVLDEGLFDLAPELSSLYVGGGTPSLLGPGAMSSLRRLLGPDRLAGAGLEWTAEANPESFSAGLGAAWREAGVNRVSLGVQTFHEPALRWMGRLHGPDGAREAVTAAKAVGLTNVSADLIFGLPPALGRSWGEDLESVLGLDVPHISLYGLTVEPRTPLGRAVAEGREQPVDEERYRAEFLQAADRITAAGYEHYEVSSFARPGYASRHNRVYWEGRPYLGLGNGAHSFRPPLRRWNVREWEQYRRRVLAGEPAEEGRERIGDAEQALERVWLGLRTLDGLAWAELSPAAREATTGWVRRGLAVRADGAVRLTPAGWLELDGLAVELDGVGAFAERRPG